jgi:TRAP-type C4-dicarboxylate transport system permease small subunit
VRPGLRRALESWCVVLLAVLGAMFAWYATRMVVDSYNMGDVSTGMLPVPLWIPQIGMAAGAVLFEIAVIEECVHVLRGHQPRYEQPAGAEAAFTE